MRLGRQQRRRTLLCGFGFVGNLDKFEKKKKNPHQFNSMKKNTRDQTLGLDDSAGLAREPGARARVGLCMNLFL